MINSVTLVGRLTKDVELRFTPNGVAVATFTLAVNRPFKNEQGEQRADFIQCVVWRKPAENAANFLRKGSLAGVKGTWQTRNFEGTDGKRVYVNECLCESVQFLETKNATGEQSGFSGTNTSNGAQNGNSGQTGTNNNQNNRYNSDPFANQGAPIDINDDDLPF